MLPPISATRIAKLPFPFTGFKPTKAVLAVMV